MSDEDIYRSGYTAGITHSLEKIDDAFEEITERLKSGDKMPVDTVMKIIYKHARRLVD